MRLPRLRVTIAFDSDRRRQPERHTRAHRELRHLAVVSTLAIIIAILLQLGLSGRGLTIHDINDITIFSALGIIIGELYPILGASLRLDHLFQKNEKILREISTKNNVQNQLTQTLLRSFEFSDEPAHEAVTTSV